MKSAKQKRTKVRNKMNIGKRVYILARLQYHVPHVGVHVVCTRPEAIGYKQCTVPHPHGPAVPVKHARTSPLYSTQIISTWDEIKCLRTPLVNKY